MKGEKIKIKIYTVFLLCYLRRKNELLERLQNELDEVRVRWS